jgi:hypothetical protein
MIPKTFSAFSGGNRSIEVLRFFFSSWERG